jgi:hypothetical protein
MDRFNAGLELGAERTGFRSLSGRLGLEPRS